MLRCHYPETLTVGFLGKLGFPLGLRSWVFYRTIHPERQPVLAAHLIDVTIVPTCPGFIG